jgi:hypothetical protein
VTRASQNGAVRHALPRLARTQARRQRHRHRLAASSHSPAQSGDRRRSFNAQFDLFGMAATSANPLFGIAVKLPSTCGDLVAIVGSGKPPHSASVLCRSCGLHRGWISRANYSFLSEIINKFGAPSEPIVFRSRSTKPEENGDGISVVQDGIWKEKPMPVISDLYSSKNLKCADLLGKPATGTISDVTVETFQNDGVRKAVLHFHGDSIKPLVVNKTNYLILAQAFGLNTDAWVGRQIVVSPSMTPFKGKMVETIHVEPLLAQAVAAVNGSGEPHYTPEEIARMEAAVLKHQAARKEAGVTSASLNDEIPKSW